MMLFDIIRNLNDSITLSIKQGMPGKARPKLMGTTDGYNVAIHFVDYEVWNSTTWQYGNGTEQEELERIQQHIKDGVMEYLTTLYNIQW